MVFTADADEIVTINHYWAMEADDDSEIDGDTVVVIDTDANIVVVTDQTTAASYADDNTVFIVMYDGNDQFTVGMSNAADAVTMSVFESSLEDGSNEDC